MTIIAAMRKNNEIWMASDRESSSYDFGRSDQVHGSKIVPFKNALIGTSGLALFKNALKYYSKTEKGIYNSRFDGETDVMDFFFKFHAFMKKKYGLGSAKNDDVEKLSYNQFMVVTQDFIYQLSCARDVSTFENYAAIGNGTEIALGAIHVLSPIIESPEEILKKAVSAACHFKLGCGGEIDIVHLPTALRQAKKKSTAKTKGPVKLVAQR